MISAFCLVNSGGNSLEKLILSEKKFLIVVLTFMRIRCGFRMCGSAMVTVL
jgi:hypothetical protein